jgi:H+/Cl- antiporter ClcA
MNNFEDIQSLWQQAPAAEAPGVHELIAGLRKKRRKMQWRTAGLVLLLLLTIFFLALIIGRYEFRFLTTKIGIALALIAVGAAVAVNSNMLALLLQNNGADTNNHQYLQSLKKFRERMRFMHTYGISIYFLLMGTGILLYIYEFVQHNILKMVLAYGLTAGWFLFAWFVLRPRTVKKQTAGIDEMIRRLNEMDGQLNG